MELALEVKNLSKKYKNFTAVSDVSFSVKKGEIFGILGPNGAGKTTTLEMIEGLRKIGSGEAMVAGIDATKRGNRASIQQKIGVQLQSSSYFNLLTLTEILNLFGSFYENTIHPTELLQMVGLEEKKNQLVQNLSGGQQQRFSIIAAIVNDPEIVFLDEPTTGLDPKIRRSLWDLIRDINGRGKTVILTTHYMEEAEELCDRVAIMDSGKIIALDSPHDLITSQGLKFTIKFTPDKSLNEDQISIIQNHEQVIKLWTEKHKITFRIEDPTRVNDILSSLEENGIKFKNLEIIPPNMEDVFLKLTGKSLR